MSFELTNTLAILSVLVEIVGIIIVIVNSIKKD